MMVQSSRTVEMQQTLQAELDALRQELAEDNRAELHAGVGASEEQGKDNGEGEGGATAMPATADLLQALKPSLVTPLPAYVPAIGAVIEHKVETAKR